MINQKYLSNGQMDQLRSHFQSDPPQSVTLYNFFHKDHLDHLFEICKGLNFQNNTAPLSHRYKTAEFSAPLADWLNNEKLLDYVSTVIQSNTEKIVGKVVKMKWRDYTILNDEQLLPTGYDLFIDLTQKWEADYGGLVTYLDSEGNTTALPPSFGAVSIVQRPDDVHYYIKYINNHAQQLDRYLIIAELVLER